jgi:hypothetical protein
MMSAAATLAVIDMVMAGLEVATRGSALINKARLEGREISTEEFKALIDENTEKRKAWDEAGE